jgi:predicted esterase
MRKQRFFEVTVKGADMKSARLIWARVLGLLVFSATAALCNTDSRNWTLDSGEMFVADLVNYDVTNDIVTLRTSDQQQKTYSQKDFAPMDSAWLLEWTQVSSDLDNLKLKGQFNHYQHKGTNAISDIYVYTPSKYKTTQNLPLLFLFNASGKGARYLKRFMEAAEALDLILVSSDSFHNTTDPVLEAKMLAIFKEILPVIEAAVPHNPSKLYMGGTSGGAMAAFGYSYQVNRPWAGIYSNVGWLGGEQYYDKPYPKMKVVMQNGNHDDAANAWVKPDARVLEKRGCVVDIFSFEGAHQVPPSLQQVEALKSLLSDHE